ncbi:MAG: leucyl aminopeptidase [Pseudomonadota bacterium]
MDISIKRGTPARQKTACFVSPIYTSKKLGATSTALDKSSRGSLSALTKRGDISGKVGEGLLVPTVSGVSADRVILIGAGKESGIAAGDFIKVAKKAASMISSGGYRNALSALTEINVVERDLSWKIRQIAIAFDAATYRFNEFKSKASGAKSAPKLSLLLDDDSVAAAKAALPMANSICNGMTLCKDLGNTPANFCTPTDLANRAKEMAKGQAKLRVEVLDEAAMKKLGMGSLLSVSSGSEQPAKLIIFHYSGGNKEDKPVVLVGKGVTFDSGGISIKGSAGMDEMKYDMCGAASVFGTLHAVNEGKLPINVIGVVPATENLPDGKATKPGDVVTSMSGQTIEILNTDAEGRLILCDALTYSDRFNPDVVIDIATLTGACIVALGNTASGLMSNDDELATDLLNAGETCGDRAWRLPIWDEYNQLIDSPFADMANVGGRAAGTITAACFLSRFTSKYRWAHLDIAGTAWKSGKAKGATGTPVPLLTQYLMSRLDT